MKEYNSIQGYTFKPIKRNFDNKKFHAPYMLQNNNSGAPQGCFLFKSTEDSDVKAKNKYDQLKLTPKENMAIAIAARRVAIRSELSEIYPAELESIQKGYNKTLPIRHLDTTLVIVYSVEFATICLTFSPYAINYKKNKYVLQGRPQGYPSLLHSKPPP
ncbi:hypothetical protein [Chromobacterium sp. ASV23]|uniref:hypothetical protein n=1 Tax=Chromobacterium sp. ASV23 TaxID=2795110 RepID=UPI0018EB03C7|nr:hypothetical protein [Chromobacterium sp. ASV23]